MFCPVTMGDSAWSKATQQVMGAETSCLETGLQEAHMVASLDHTEWIYHTNYTTHSVMPTANVQYGYCFYIVFERTEQIWWTLVFEGGGVLFESVELFCDININLNNVGSLMITNINSNCHLARPITVHYLCETLGEKSGSLSTMKIIWYWQS